MVVTGWLRLMVLYMVVPLEEDLLSRPEPLRIAQISDIHCGSVLFDGDLLRMTAKRLREAAPDVIVLAGDLTAEGYEWEFEEAAEWLDQFDAPLLVVPGNHDARNLGYLHFERLFGDRFPTLRLDFEDERAAALDARGVTLVGVDSSEPDRNAGRIGREWYGELERRFDAPGHLKVFVLHHHLVSIPGTGRERSTVEDAGDVLDLLARLRVDVVLSGHKHVPFFWGLNGMLICNSGTTSTRRVRGLTPPSWNEVSVHRDHLEVHTHYPDGRRELSVRRVRAGRSEIHAALRLTPEFRSTNRVDLAVEHG